MNVANPVPLVDGWGEIQADPRKQAHARRLLNGVGKYSPDAVKLVKYLSEFITMKCAPDMITLRLFPNAKEISESFAAYDAVRYKLPSFALGDPGVTIVAVGDGRTPRTAATFAFRSAWTCHSVDPALRGGVLRWAAIQRLHLWSSRIEDVRIEAERVIVVAVHSHARLPAAVQSIRCREMAVVSIPCCVAQQLDRPPDVEYQDSGIISPCRTVKVWAPQRMAAA